MLDAALAFLVKSVNSWLELRLGTSLGTLELSKPVDEAGKWAITLDRVGVSLLNVEEERVLKAHLPETTIVDGRHVVLQPPLKLNLHVLFAANCQQYDQALKSISQVLTFFQANPSFSSSTSPGLDPRIEKLTLELQSLGYEQLNQIWAFIGAKQLPSVIYKARMVVVQDREPVVAVPAADIDVRLTLR